MNQQFLTKLRLLLQESEILENELMSRHTTFKCGGPAGLYIAPRADRIADVVKLCRQFHIDTYIIGNGSNLLVTDKGIDGVVIEIQKNMSKISTNAKLITAEAGALLSKVAFVARDEGLTGLEWAAGIPGCVGGGLTMNAGAYGGEMKQVVKEATVLTRDNEIIKLGRDELELSYRHSIIPEKGYIVLSVTFELEEGSREDIQAAMDDFNQRRKDKQPLEYPSAGSTFKRPEGYFAGKLIEDAGLKGYRVGGAEVSEKHCGFVINKDGATSQDVIELMDDVSNIVYDKFGVRLEPEVKIIGRR